MIEQMGAWFVDVTERLGAFLLAGGWVIPAAAAVVWLTAWGGAAWRARQR